MTEAEEIQRLKDRIEELEEAFGLSERLPATYFFRNLFQGYGPSVREMAQMLLARPMLDRSAAYTVLYGALPDHKQPESNVVDVFMHRVRASLTKIGVEIEAVPGRGWRLTNENRRKLQQAIEVATREAA